VIEERKIEAAPLPDVLKSKTSQKDS